MESREQLLEINTALEKMSNDEIGKIKNVQDFYQYLIDYNECVYEEAKNAYAAYDYNSIEGYYDLFIGDLTSEQEKYMSMMVEMAKDAYYEGTGFVQVEMIVIPDENGNVKSSNGNIFGMGKISIYSNDEYEAYEYKFLKDEQGMNKGFPSYAYDEFIAEYYENEYEAANWVNTIDKTAMDFPKRVVYRDGMGNLMTVSTSENKYEVTYSVYIKKAQ